MIESNKKIIFNMEGLTMIGIKNNNGFFRISVAVIMLLSILGLRMRATPTPMIP